jgi:hypothetical protein
MSYVMEAVEALILENNLVAFIFRQIQKLVRQGNKISEKGFREKVESRESVQIHFYRPCPMEQEQEKEQLYTI